MRVARGDTMNQRRSGMKRVLLDEDEMSHRLLRRREIEEDSSHPDRVRCGRAAERRTGMRWLGVITAAALLWACGDGNSGEGPAPVPVRLIPAKTVVLTFDDAQRSHLEFVVPILEEHGFGATFFVTSKWMEDRENYLSWEEVGEFARRGFEIGNHGWAHYGCNRRIADEYVHDEIEQVERALERVGCRKPVSFAWPGGGFGPEGIEILKEHGYLLARRCLSLEFLVHGPHVGLAYDPRKHHPHLIPTTAMPMPGFGLEKFKATVAKAVEGQAAVFTFHGIPDRTNEAVSTEPSVFRECMDYLKKNGYRVVALRELAPYAESAGTPSDPLALQRWPDD
jgi:peptidoglycan/xylan/chitin deacetylase (PgdA/CDA1 family)